MKTALTFDDVQLLDNYSELDSRSDVDLDLIDPKSGKRIMELPIFAAAMDTVVSAGMASIMIGEYGAGVIHHRGCSGMSRVKEFKNTEKRVNKYDNPKVGVNGVAIGLDEHINYIRHLIKIGVDVIAIEVAAANNKNVMKRIKEVGRFTYPSNTRLMVGNISDIGSFARNAPLKFVDFIKLSQGGGSVCLTREETGIGKPTFQAVKDAHEYISNVYYNNIMIVADGGLRKNADIVKSYGAGASAVMLGSMLSNHDENYYGEYRGMASEKAKKAAGQRIKNIEGTSVDTSGSKGSISETLKRMEESVQSGIATSGFESHEDFVGNGRFVRVTNSGVLESAAHAKN